MTQIARVNNKVGLLGHSVDFVNGDLKRCCYIGVGGFVKSDVAVADLDEAEICAFHRVLVTAFCEGARNGNASTEGPNQSCTRPCHTLQKPTTVDAVIVEILQVLINQVVLLVCHLASS